MKSKRLILLDLVRGGAALAVFLGHLRAMVFPDFESLISPSILHKAFYFCTGLGHQGVVVFFVLSGFFVGGSVVSLKKEFVLKKYLTSRLVRLWIVLLPALMLTAIVDTIVQKLRPEILQGVYYAEWNSGPRPQGIASDSFLTFCGNMFFTQTILCPVFGTNSPLWSLANEFWYYMTFPALTILSGWSVKPGNAYMRLLSGGFLVWLWFFLPQGIKEGFCQWLMGVAVYLLARKTPHIMRKKITIYGLILFLGSLCYVKNCSTPQAIVNGADWIVGISFAIWLLGICQRSDYQLQPLLQKMIKYLSESSYTLYVVHFPLLILFASALAPGFQLIKGGAPLIQFCVIGLIIYIFSSLWWILFERNTEALRNQMFKLIIRKAASGKKLNS